jgi:hypothetical protein
MSLVQYDEIYEICCELMEEEETVVKRARPVIKRVDLVKVPNPNSNRWLESAREILHEREKELFYV